MSGASFDDALSALVAAFTAGAPAGVEVIDGEAVDPKQRKFLCVGWDESDQHAVNVVRDYVAYADVIAREGCTVACLLSCWVGDRSVIDVRAEARAALAAFDAALAADRTLGGVVERARITNYTYGTDNRAEGGALAQIHFFVAYDALNV